MKTVKIILLLAFCSIVICGIVLLAYFHGAVKVAHIPVKTVRAGDIDIAYRQIGNGHPLIMIMGYGGTMDVWDPTVLRRLSSKYTVIIFDNRGAGKSSDSGRNFTIELLADDTARFMDAAGIKRAHVLGYSMGSEIAQELALRYPEKVDKLVLYAADFGGTEGSRPAPEVVQMLTDTSGTPKERVERFVRLLFPESWLKENPYYYVRLPKENEIVTNEIATQQARAMMSWPGSYSRLPLISQDTLLITGLDDGIMPPQNSFIMAGRIPASWLIRFKGGGHGVMYQWPEDFSKAVLTFLENR